MKLPTSIFLLFFLFTSNAFAAGCAPLKDFKTKISMELETPPPAYDFTKTIRQMNKGMETAHREWLKKNGMNPIWASALETNGIAAGGWGLALRSQIDGKPLQNFGFNGCLFFRQLSLSMMYRTIINIPKEYPKGSCAHNVIWVHELKHHKTNVAIVQKAVERLRNDLPIIVAEMERSAAGVDHRYVADEAADLKRKIDDAINIYLTQQIAKEMERQNSKIDSPEEYKLNSKLIDECKNL